MCHSKTKNISNTMYAAVEHVIKHVVKKNALLFSKLNVDYRWCCYG